VLYDGGGADTVEDYKAGHDKFDFTQVSGVHGFGRLALDAGRFKDRAGRFRRHAGRVTA